MAEIWNLRPAGNATSGLKPLKRLLPCPHCGEQPVFRHSPATVWMLAGGICIHTPALWYAYCGTHEYGGNYFAVGRTLRQAQADWQALVAAALRDDDKNPGALNWCRFCGRRLGRHEGNNAEPLNGGVCCDRCNMLIVIPARLAVWRDGNGLFGRVARG